MAKARHVYDRVITAVILLSLPVLVAAQSSGKRGATAETDSIPLFRGIAVSFDVVGAVQMHVSSYGQYEAALRVNLRDRYFPVIEVGYGKADAEDVATKLTYEASAPYGRIGIDFNLVKNKHDAYRVYGGLRYAYTAFDFDVAATEPLTDPVWGDEVAYSLQDVSVSYHWMEVVVGVDAKMWGPLRLGWSVRYKRRLFHDDGDAGNTWYVPGYGKQGGSRFGATFNIIFEL